MKRSTRNDCARRTILTEHPRVDLVHSFPQVDVCNRNVHLKHAIPVAACSFENCVNVAERLFGLFLDRPEFLFTRLRIDGQLPCYKNETIVDGGL